MVYILVCVSAKCSHVICLSLVSRHIFNCSLVFLSDPMRNVFYGEQAWVVIENSLSFIPGSRADKVNSGPGGAHVWHWPQAQLWVSFHDAAPEWWLQQSEKVSTVCIAVCT